MVTTTHPNPCHQITTKEKKSLLQTCNKPHRKRAPGGAERRLKLTFLSALWRILVWMMGQPSKVPLDLCHFRACCHGNYISKSSQPGFFTKVMFPKEQMKPQQEAVWEALFLTALFRKLESLYSASLSLTSIFSVFFKIMVYLWHFTCNTCKCNTVSPPAHALTLRLRVAQG